MSQPTARGAAGKPPRDQHIDLRRRAPRRQRDDTGHFESNRERLILVSAFHRHERGRSARLLPKRKRDQSAHPEGRRGRSEGSRTAAAASEFRNGAAARARRITGILPRCSSSLASAEIGRQQLKFSRERCLRQSIPELDAVLTELSARTSELRGEEQANAK